MIKTDKYKKGILALTDKATQLNPELGRYETHYLNAEARFIVQLSNGRLEVDIDMARQYEENPDMPQYGRLRKIAFSLNNEENYYRHASNIDSAWRKLFAKQTKI